ncbi:MAG: excinuclease ABC subunit UvrA [Planctomycetota bacterium]|nr:excinuclease ABC subunit UvrA [Planctomycetota bacterium]
MERHLDRKGFRKVEKYCTSVSCPDCRGSRLNLWATHVTFRDLALSEVTDWSVEQARSWFSDLALSGREKVIGGPVVSEIVRRLSFLCDVGVGYLTLNRSARSLSGGEAQRVRLAAQVGSGLQGVLFVLDEPSIGLHPRDNGRLLSTLRALTSSGNTVIVVEHDEETIRASDCLVDVGPGAGREGGEVLAFGPTHKVIAQAKTLTTDYLQGRREITAPETRRDPGGECLDIRGARQHNLKNIDVSIPLGCFVAVTGVSGSGKSTLVDHILRRALAGVLQGSEAIPGEHDGIDGVELLDKVIEIDQQPIGRTPRSNPATYTGLMTRIRDVFAGTNEARMRGFGKGRFSFNVRGGRCEACEGGGVNVVELQFLADVRVVCEICGGRRYNAETMEILYRGKSIADVLALTVADALEFFEHHNQIRQMLETLSDVGLGYITLGQPATSLSGGEAQRVKLAKELGRPSTGKTLYILDEPTTGLHFEDVRHLVAVLQRLVDRGNTVLVVEHNLELVKCADWVIDLGPDGGDAGGEVVALGTPKNVAQAPASHTGAALAQHLSTRKRSAGKAKSKRKAKARPSDLCVRGASIHNLDGIDVTIPQGALTVVTGPSGSGKTSLAFHTIFAEGQRRYVESLSTYARRFLARMDRPPIESIDGISPAVAIDQKYASRNPRSTVATSTEIYDYLRLLFSRVGDTHCWGCGKEIRKWSSSEAAQEVVKKAAGQRATITCTLFDRENPQRGLTPRLKGLSEMIVEFAKEGFVRLLVDGAELKIEEFSKDRVGGVVELVIDRLQVNRRRKSRLAESLTLAQQRGLGVARIHLEGGDVMNFEARLGCAPCDLWIPGGELTPRMFSFNNAAGACSSCEGLGRLMTVREDLLIDRPERPLLEGAMTSRVGRYLSRPGGYQTHVLRALAEREGVSLDRAWSLLPQGFRQVALHGSGDAEAVPVTFARGKGNQSRFYDYQVDWRGLLGTVEHWWSGTQRPGWWRGSLESLMEEAPCPGCRGGRLQPWALAARVDGMGIFELCQMDISSARQWVHGLDLDGRKAEVAADIVRQVQHRLDFLDNVGVGYLSLVRSSATLSGGESQRIRLASQLGNQLVGVLYVLDEPTIGLHPKDTGRLLETLKNLQALGNTVLVVEHDRDTIEAADHLIDLGPGAGESGGRVVFQGKAGDVYRSRRSLTGQYLSGKRIVDWPKERRSAKAWLTLEKATRHNLKGVTLRIPLGTLCVVTGVSGSGKSTLVTDLLVPATQHATGGGVALPEDMGALKGARHLRKVVVVDQSPVARSTQSNPATYTGCFDDIRKAFAETEEAKLRGFGPGRFSPNVPGGRCESCEGRGFELVEMHFLSDVSIRCESCRGSRFEKETLEVKYRGHSISDVLSMTVSEAITCFGEYAGVLRKLTFLEDVGLGYLRLGQPTNTLSGGEAQRLKLAAELARPDQGKALVVLDEPTTGLHFEDVSRLVAVLHRMVDMGDSVVVIEHNVDVIKNADWIVDLGPSGGEGGGQIMAEGPPEKIASDKTSEMASFVKRGLEMAAS